MVYTAIECHAETKDSRRKLPSSPAVITSLLFSIVDKTIGKMKKNPVVIIVRTIFGLFDPDFSRLDEP